MTLIPFYYRHSFRIFSLLLSNDTHFILLPTFLLKFVLSTVNHTRFILSPTFPSNIRSFRSHLPYGYWVILIARWMWLSYLTPALGPSYI
ncbi:hypothetical protein BDR06DRAFT_723757 [Suillus hirtellus]|nr:hypothetical protein BDR06DRAFT_723757 [Suillus hirtellus]